MKLRVPVLTCFMVGMALLVYRLPHLGALLMYDRQAILGGEWWRLGTAPLVHFSFSHLGWNSLVLGAAGWAVEALDYRHFWLVCAVAALIPGMVYILAAPELAVYGGLSGLASGAVAYLCLGNLLTKGRNRTLWIAILVLMVGKIVAEASLEVPVFARPDGVPFRALPLVHVAGILGAASAMWWTLRQRGRDPQQGGGPHRRQAGRGCEMAIPARCV